MSQSSSGARDVAHKAVFAVLALGSRQFFVHGLNLLGNILLARLLSPADFGIYAVVIFLATFLNTFGGTGLASNLIRSITAPSEDEYSAVFTMQQLLLSVVTTALFCVSPWLTRVYRLPASYVWLFWMAAASLLITSFAVIPQIKLERELAFSKLAAAEVWQAVIFNGCAVSLAWKGYGGLSFAYALLARSIAGVIAIYIAQPWRPRWHWDLELIRGHFSFGIFYQFSQVVSLLKDAITPLLLGFVLGVVSVGYTSWASMLASYPVLALMVFQRVYLPTFARLHHDPVALRKFVEKVVLVTNIIVAPAAVFSLALIYPITGLVYGTKWFVAIPLFVLFWFTNLFSPTSTPFLGVLNALGASRTVFAFTLFWMILTWAIGIPLVLWLGAIGLAWANICVQISNLALFALVKRRLPVRILPEVAPGWILAASLGGLLWGYNRLHPIATIPLLILLVAVGGILYMLGIMFWHGKEIRQLLALVRSRRTA